MHFHGCGWLYHDQEQDLAALVVCWYCYHWSRKREKRINQHAVYERLELLKFRQTRKSKGNVSEWHYFKPLQCYQKLDIGFARTPPSSNLTGVTNYIRISRTSSCCSCCICQVFCLLTIPLAQQMDTFNSIHHVSPFFFNCVTFMIWIGNLFIRLYLE